MRNESRATLSGISGSNQEVRFGHDPDLHPPKTREEVQILGRQLLRSGTSVAAHVREASRARSNEEFISKLGGALQETDESALWLELLREECGIAAALTEPLEKESSELIAIFITMINRTKGER
jgi:four helix bundle protein